MGKMGNLERMVRVLQVKVQLMGRELMCHRGIVGGLGEHVNQWGAYFDQCIGGIKNHVGLAYVEDKNGEAVQMVMDQRTGQETDKQDANGEGLEEEKVTVSQH